MSSSHPSAASAPLAPETANLSFRDEEELAAHILDQMLRAGNEASSHPSFRVLAFSTTLS